MPRKVNMFLAALQTQKDQAAMSVAKFLDKNTDDDIGEYLATLVKGSNSDDANVCLMSCLSGYGLLTAMIEREEAKETEHETD